MSLAVKFIPKATLLGALALTTVVIGEVAQAHPIPVEATAAVQAVSITKARAESIAQQAAGGGTVVLALLEREDGSVHWSIDIVSSTAEHEVWVSTTGRVIKIITQPL